jgi:uncharacterized protein (DUF885 family)
MRGMGIGALALALTLAGCGPSPGADAPAQSTAEADAALTQYLDAEFEEELQQSPQTLTRLGRKERYDELDDPSEAALDRALAWRRESVAEMRERFDPDALSPEGRTSYDIWELELARAEEDAKWRRHQYVFGWSSPHTGLPNFLINFHKVAAPADMEAWIVRAGKIGPAIDAYLARAQAAAGQGVRPPRFAYEQALGEIKRVTGGAPFAPGDPSPLYADALTKIAALETAGSIDAAQAEDFRKRAADAMTTGMKPAYDRLASWLTADAASADAEPRGASALPDGAAFYQARLRDQTTTDLTAEEIHQLGLAEVARIRGEMETVKTRAGFTGTLEEFFEFMRTDRRFYLPSTDEGRARYIAQAESYIAAMKAKLPDYFGRLPRSELVVRRVEAFREQPGGAAHYMTGAPDGSRPGVFYAHLVDMDAVALFQLEALAYHEGLPGHHMERSLAMELEGVPAFRTQYGYAAYSEGWGLYAEALGKEMGFFTDPYSDFGRLSSEMWRAIRLVVDTGLHAKGWTREQAEQYALANSPRARASVTSEVRRYLVNPGQATSYKIGELRIRQIREKAQAALGDRFDIKGFHDVVVGGGALPLPILERRVDAWVAQQQAS